MTSNSRLKLIKHPDLCPAEPLYNRVPTRDITGQRLSDFMMLIPKLRQQPQAKFNQVIQQLQEVLESYQHAIVFADLNLQLNVLWVSVKPIPGICLELPASILARIPEARLVAQPPEHH